MHDRLLSSIFFNTYRNKIQIDEQSKEFIVWKLKIPFK